ncbi:MAG: hypothetical protein INR70_44700 [Parafilimonas terrae]|nr:hypothetical protein [Parafilimonas terrae]
MLYIPPAGSSDPNASYVGASTAQQRDGSFVSPEAIEFPLRELSHLVEASDQVPTGDDLYQVVRAIRSGRLSYFDDVSTTPGTIVINSLAAAPAHTRYTKGLPVFVKLNQDITGATSLNLDGLGARQIYHSGGGQLFKGDYRKGDVIELRGSADGTSFTACTPVSQFIIDTATIKTAHGVSPDFSDLIQAATWLSRRRIALSGNVAFNLPNATGASKLVYAADIVLDHPDLARVTVNGQPLAGSVPAPGGFTITGYGAGNRIADTAVNLATLRGIFQTEIAFTGGKGIKINGPVLIGNLLVTSDGVSGAGLAATDTIIAYGSGSTLSNVWTAGSGYRGICCSQGSMTLKGSCGAIGSASDGISAERGAVIYVQGSAVALSSGARGIRGFLNGQVLSADLVTSALAAYGNASDGIAALSGGGVQAASPSASKQNGGSGFAAITNAWITANNASSDGNAVDGFQSWENSQVDAQNATGTNGRFGFYSNISGTIYRSGATCTGASAAASPSVGSTGNQGSNIY